MPPIPCPLPVSSAQLATCQMITAQIADHRYLGLAALSIPPLVGLVCAVKAISRRPKGKRLHLSPPFPWGRHRATKRAKQAFAATKLAKFGPKGSRAFDVRKRTKHASGEEWEVEFHPGDSAVHFNDPTTLEEIASALGVHRVHIDRKPEARQGTVQVIERDPLVVPVTTPLLTATTTSFRNIDLGTDDRGQPVVLKMVDEERGCRHLLIGGVTGGGKSVVMHNIIATAALDPTVDLWPFDPKGGAELGAWRPASKVFVGNNLDDILGEAISRANDLMKIIKARFEEGAGHGERIYRFDADHRLMVVVIDELSELVGTSGLRKEFANLLERISKLSRSVGIVMVAATQRPSADVVPTIIRTHYVYRLALRCMDPDSSDTVLGKGHAARGYDASMIADSNPGEGWLLSDGVGLRRIRAYNFPDEALKPIAARAAALRSSGAKPIAAEQFGSEVQPSPIRLTVVAGSALPTSPPPPEPSQIPEPISQGNHPQPPLNEPPAKLQPRFVWTERDHRIHQRLGEGPMRRKDIAAEFFPDIKSKSRVTDVMDRHVRNGTVQKTEPGREVEYQITRSGRQELARRETAEGGDAA